MNLNNILINSETSDVAVAAKSKAEAKKPDESELEVNNRH